VKGGFLHRMWLLPSPWVQGQGFELKYTSLSKLWDSLPRSRTFRRWKRRACRGPGFF